MHRDFSQGKEGCIYQKKLDRYLDLTTREVQEVERGERKLTSGQIRVWGEKININES